MPRRAFTLPLVLVAMAGLLILLGGLLTIVGLERQTARAHLDGYNAELAARSALAEVRMLLSENADKDSYMVIRAPIKVAFDDDGDGTIGAEEDVERPYLFLVEGEIEEDEGGALLFEYTPLFSTDEAPDETATLEDPEETGLPEDDEDRVSLRALPWEEAPVLAWRYLEDSQGKRVARYAYWVEDTEAYLDAWVAGNSRGEGGQHARTAALWPDDWVDGAPGGTPYPKDERYLAPWNAPGLGFSVDVFAGTPLDQIGLYALDGESEQDDTTDFDNRIFGARDLAPTPASLLAAMEIPAPLKRDENGHLENEEGRRLEENVTISNRSYYERAVIPPVPGIDAAMTGEPKLNLNLMVETGGAGAVEEIVAYIREAFPQFETRKGGFPEDYLATLAANMIDYADALDAPTYQEDRYRGVDSYPLVSEWLMRFKWGWEGDPYDGVGILTENGRKYVLLTVAAYAELWNMSSHPVRGEVQLDYETNYSFDLGAVPGVSLMDEGTLNRSIAEIDPKASESGSEHDLSKNEDDERWYFPPFQVELEPDEYLVKKVGLVRYKIDAGLSFMWIPSPLQLGNDDGSSKYTMRWNGAVADHSRGGLERSDATLNYPSDSRSSPRQKVRGTIPGFHFGSYGVYHNGMGDPRTSYYGDVIQGISAYPANYSGWRRNVRLRIFRGNPTAVYGRVIPSEWPDRGHDSPFGSDSYYTEDQRVNPDDPRFEASKPFPDPRKAPMRISNLGRFFSESELGHIFDPVMWGTKRNLPSAAVEAWTKEVTAADHASNCMGGGNTLRIGRPEHPRFDSPGLRASGLLDLFHVGNPFLLYDEENAKGEFVIRNGHVNINTAPRDVLRTLAAGILVQDPALALELSPIPDRGKKAPPTRPLEVGAPTASEPADLIADAIIANRPFVSPSQLALVEDESGRRVFGNSDLYPQRSRLQWSDAAAEETFARVYNSATVRSRNFRVHVIGQAIREAGDEIRVLSTRRKVFKVFADPGERDEEGEIDPEEMKIEVQYETNR